MWFPFILTRTISFVSEIAFNLKGKDGGGLIANGAAVDAYRLGMQYGLADAVMVGSNTVSIEGKYYLHLPYKTRLEIALSELNT